jgi:1-deoxy-D-xylulose-5-phosphate synthase
MVQLARENPKVMAVTAAMAEGTGLLGFAREFPDRFFDVGIAEAHGVTFSAGLAVEGMRPVAAIYSTFLQRAYDQIIHDVALQHLPVVFALDRAGLVGEDGPTHHGVFDLSYLGCIPGMVVAAPRSGAELLGLMRSALQWTEGPFAIRYPRDQVPEGDMPAFPDPIPVGSWEELRPVAPVTFLAVGSMVAPALEAAEILEREGITPGVVNCRFVRPLDGAVLARVQERARHVVTLEESSVHGGFGSQVQHWFEGRPGAARPAVLTIGLPDVFIQHGSRRKLLEICGLTASEIAKRVRHLPQVAPEASRGQPAGGAAPAEGVARPEGIGLTEGISRTGGVGQTEGVGLAETGKPAAAAPSRTVAAHPGARLKR